MNIINKDDLFDRGNSIKELFEYQVNQTPKNIAFIYKEKKFTYKELNHRANQLAHLLITKYNLKIGDMLVLCLERNENMLISILASLKIGAVYVPIEPTYPIERISYIIKDTKNKLILTNEKHILMLKNIINNQNNLSKKSQILSIDKDKVIQNLNNLPHLNLKIKVKSQDLAYVIYTSGTTGLPKGVMIEHKGVINLIKNQARIFELDFIDKNDNKNKYKNCLWFSNYVFDAHVWDVFAPLCYGHTLHMIDNDTRQHISLLEKYILNNKIHIATIPPALLDTNTLLSLQYLVVAGEKTEKKILDYYIKNNKCIINAYGPTEITVCSHFKRFQGGNPNIIGKSIENVFSYVLDDNLKLVSEGVIGELYIGGVGVARGYLNRPDLTKEQFIKNHFESDNDKFNTHLYKTGDFVRLLEDNTLEYIERRDSQIKVNGYRIDLGEIENQLSKHPEIIQNVVQLCELTEGKSKQIIAYYVANNPLEDRELNKYLENTLPIYMRPNQYLFLKKFPLTINGKIDKKALPKANISTGEGLKPRNATEKMICQIFSDALSLEAEKLSLSDDFIQLGGNSILAGKIATNLNNYFGSNLQISEILSIRRIGAIYDAMLLTKNNYRYLIKLNWAQNKPLFFMIHDGIAGCELYTELANKLGSDFICYGVDNYNLYHDKKIDNLEILAKLYLEKIMNINEFDNNKEKHYYFFGVCLGGVIAAYLSILMEEMGFTNVTLISWDSIISDDVVQKIRKKNSLSIIKKSLVNLFKGVSEDLINKISNSVKANNCLLSTIFNKKLNRTNVILFKALVIDDSIDILRSEYEYICSLPYNNFEVVQPNMHKIKVIELKSVKHSGFLSQIELVVKTILSLTK